jgi:hypothetical protein
MAFLKRLRELFSRERAEFPGKRLDEMAATDDRMSDALGGGAYNSVPPNYFPKQDEGQPRH